MFGSILECVVILGADGSFAVVAPSWLAAAVVFE